MAFHCYLPSLGRIRIKLVYNAHTCNVFCYRVLEYSVIQINPVAYRGGWFGGFKPPREIPKISVGSSIA